MGDGRPTRLGRQLIQRVRDDDVLGLAAEIAYRFLFAVFPFGLFVAALGAFIAGWLHVGNPADELVAGLSDNLPPTVADALRPELERLLSSARGDLLWVGAIGALWAATGGTNAVVKGIHRAYDVPEARPFLLRYTVAVGLTLLAAAGVIVSFVTIVGGAVLTTEAAERVGLGAEAFTLIQLARWPVVFLALTAAVSILYRYAPRIVVPWRWILAGAAVFTLGWLAATAALGYYVEHIAAYGATYGSLGGVIVLMLWFYVTAALLLVGAQLTATLTRGLTPDQIRYRGEEAAASEAVDEATDRMRRNLGAID
jgi:membrane protein